MKKNLRTPVLLAALAALTPPLQATIEIDYGDKKQEIHGFGGNVAIDSTPFYTDIRDANTSPLALTDAKMEELSKLLFTNEGDGLNVTLLRVSNFFDYKKNFTDTAYTTRPGDPKKGIQFGINYVNYLRSTRKVMEDFRRLRPAASDQRGSIIMTAWSPPPYLKSNNSSFGGTLRDHPTTGNIDYEGFAAWWIRSLDHYRTYSGVVPDILSIQNEPDFTSSQWEGSRLYASADTAPVYQNAFYAVRNRLEDIAAYNDGKLQYMAPDTSAITPDAARVKSFLSTISPGDVDIIAHHLYDTTDTSGVATAKAEITAGKVSKVVMSNTGGGYESRPSVSFSAPLAGGTVATGHAKIADGMVTSIVVDTPGSGYTTPPKVTISDPTTTAKLNQTALEAAYPHETFTKYQTEYTGKRSPGDWRYYVELIHNTLVYERANTYLVWDLLMGCVGTPSNTASKTHCYYALAHYSKFIPVTAERVPAVARNIDGNSDSDILVSAYRKERGWIGNDRLEDQLILVVCNMSESETKTHTIKLRDTANGSYWDNIVSQRYLKIIRTTAATSSAPSERLNWIKNEQGSATNPLGGDVQLILPPRALVTVIIN